MLNEQQHAVLKLVAQEKGGLKSTQLSAFLSQASARTQVPTEDALQILQDLTDQGYLRRAPKPGPVLAYSWVLTVKGVNEL